VLLGAKNIEQSKLLDFASLKTIFSDFNKLLRLQREILARNATEENFKALLQYNGELIGIESKACFYYDPHTEGYTGGLKILKSWSGSSGKVKKSNKY